MFSTSTEMRYSGTPLLRVALSFEAGRRRALFFVAGFAAEAPFFLVLFFCSF